ncbi:putative Ig domain-containing protein [Brucella pseudogrignonensis]|uniref:putative Ig domain-containing protein n=1 Tax=Brucella pseudogrignonensis TaxID=419475 RepID=UPI0038D1F4B8
MIAIDVSGLPTGGKVNLAYGSHIVTASGGTSDYTYEISGLPAGLTASGNSVSGTPTTAGTYTVTVKATDAEGYEATQTQQLVIAEAPVIAIDVSGLPTGGKVNLAYGSHIVTASGGTSDYTYEISGLPAGLTASGNSVSGTPTTAGTYTVTVKATDAEGYEATQTQQLVIAEAPVIAIDVSGLPTGGKVNLAYGSHIVTASGGTSDYTYEISGLPAGLTASGNSVSGTPTTAGTYTVTVKATDAEGYEATQTQQLVIAEAPVIAIDVSGLPTGGKVNLAYGSHIVTASGGTSDYTYEISGLPAGLTASGNSVSGTPTTAGTYTVTVKATDAEGYEATQTQQLVIAEAPVIAIDVSGLPTGGKVNLAYGSHIVTASGGTSDYTYEISGLPAGLTASGNSVSGTPTTAGTYTVTVKATDAEGYEATQTQQLVIAEAPVIAIDVSGLPTGGKVNLAYGSHIVTASGGTSDYTYEISGLPAGLTASGNSVSGTPTTAGTYTVTVKATDAEGYEATQTQQLVIAEAPVIAIDVSGLPTGGKVNLAYGSHIVTASGGTSDYTYEISGLPAGLTASGNSVSGTPTTAGTYTVTVKATDAEGYEATQTQQLVIAEAPVIAIDVSGLPTGGKVNLAYGSHIVTASGGTSDYTYEISGLPAGLTASGNSVSGTPTTAGTYTVTVKATDAEGYEATQTQQLVIAEAPVIAIDVSGLPTGGKVNLAYGSHIVTASGGTSDYTYEISGLPAGLTASGNSVSGTPTTAGTYTVTVKATDAEGYEATQTQQLVIAEAPVIAIDVSGLPTGGKVNLAYGSHIVTASGGTSDYTYEISGLPAGLTASGNSVSGTPTTAGTYTVTVKATDAEGYEATQTQQLVIAEAPVIAIDVSGLPTGGKVNLAYGSHIVTASGGTSDYTYEISGLPAGLTASGNSVSGTPTTAGTYTVTVKATDAEGYEATQTQQLVIAEAPVIAIDVSGLPTGGKVNLAYGSHIVTASGGTSDYTYEISGLPAGLTASGNSVSGTPTTAGTYTVTVKATDAEGYEATQTQQLVIAEAPVIAIDVSGLPTGGKVNLAYGSHIVTASGGTSDYTYEISGLPAGLTASGNSVSGTPTTAGTYTVTVKATDAEGYEATQTQQLVIAEAPVIAIDVSGLPTGGKVNLAYGSHIVTASGGTSDYTYEISGLPAGLTASGNSVSGTPTTAGTYTVTVKATDAEGYVGTVSQTMVIEEKVTVVAINHDLTVMAGTTGSVNLADGSSGGVVSGASIVSQADAAAGSARIEQQILYFAAAATYAGTTELTYTLLSEGSASDPAKVTIRVIARPDPSQDPEVIGLVNAQVQTSNRMAQMQIRNFQQRLEQLHGEGACRHDSIALSVGLDGGNLNPKLMQQPGCSEREFSLWTAGEVNLGRSATDDNNEKKLDHNSIGVSGGVDYRFSPSFIGGIGFGYGKDTTDIGQNGTQSRANMFSLAAYGSYRPGTQGLFLDGVVGYGWLNFESDRFVTSTGQIASGERDGKQIFGSVSLGYEYRNETWLWSPYLRGDAAQTKLSGFSETGADIFNLTYGDQTADMLSATLGLRGEYTIPMNWGELKPKGRLEYTHDFAGSSKVNLGYADIGGLLPYMIEADSDVKDSFRIEAGFDASVNGGWTTGLDYSTRIGTDGGKIQHGFRWKLSKQF